MEKHSITHNTANDGNMLLCAVNLKEQLVEHLKTTFQIFTIYGGKLNRIIETN